MARYLLLLVVALASWNSALAQEGEKEQLAAKLLRICMDPKLEDVEGAQEVFSFI